MRSHLYYNEFKIPFIVGANYEAMKEDNYALNKVKFESMAKKFYEYWLRLNYNFITLFIICSNLILIKNDGIKLLY